MGSGFQSTTAAATITFAAKAQMTEAALPLLLLAPLSEAKQ